VIGISIPVLTVVDKNCVAGELMIESRGRLDVNNSSRQWRKALEERDGRRKKQKVKV
jgi:hypothetical protein